MNVDFILSFGFSLEVDEAETTTSSIIMYSPHHPEGSAVTSQDQSTLKVSTVMVHEAEHVCRRNGRMTSGIAAVLCDGCTVVVGSWMCPKRECECER